MDDHDLIVERIAHGLCPMCEDPCRGKKHLCDTCAQTWAKCSACWSILPLEAFRRHKGTRNGRAYWCNLCNGVRFSRAVRRERAQRLLAMMQSGLSYTKAAAALGYGRNGESITHYWRKQLSIPSRRQPPSDEWMRVVQAMREMGYTSTSSIYRLIRRGALRTRPNCWPTEVSITDMRAYTPSESPWRQAV